MERHVTDFECTIDEPVAVWLWYDYNVDTGFYNKGKDIESFIRFVEQHPKDDFYFHNLSYDGSFIFDYLINVRKVKHNVTDYPTFEPTLQGETNDFTYIFDFDKWANFIDTRAILTGSLANFAKSVGMTKGDTSKDAMYTNAEIPKLTKEQWKAAEVYCKLDVEILAHVCEAYHLFELMQIRRTKAGLAYAGLTEFKLETSHYVFSPNKRPKKPTETSDEANIQTLPCVVYCSMEEYAKSEDKRKEKTELLSNYEKWSANKSRSNVVLRRETLDWDFDLERFNNRKFETGSIELDEPYLFYVNPIDPYRLKYNKRKYGEDFYERTKHVNMDFVKLMNKAIKSAYKGGVNYVNPFYKNKWINEDVYVYDINSMYPWIYSTMPMPDVRTLRGSKTIERDDLGFVFFDILKATVKPNKMPLIKLKTEIKHANASHYEPIVDIERPFTLTNLEYQYLLDNYDIEEMGDPKFMVCKENKELHEAFSTFCKYWYKQKKEARKLGDITAEWFAKLMLNSLYGKFGQFDSVYENFEYVEEDDKLVKANSEKYTDSMWDADLAVASYITAYGRVKLANDINEIGLDRFCYCDTDSLHVLGEAKELDVGLELGQWKLEGISKKSKFIKAKTYGELIDDEWHSVCAGFTDNIPMEDFEAGMVIKVTRSFLVRGGTQICDVYNVLGADVAKDFERGYSLDQLERMGYDTSRYR